METYYLVDFENVHDEGVKNIKALTKNDHVIIFYTNTAKKVDMDHVFVKEVNVDVKKVKEGNQSLDKHLSSYLGYLIGKNGEGCKYVIVAEDKGYDRIIEFWSGEGFNNITRITKITAPKEDKKETKADENTQNAIIRKVLESIKSGDERTDINTFVQHKLAEMGYGNKAYNRICHYVVQYSNSENPLNDMHNSIKKDFPEKSAEVYKDIKTVLEEYSSRKADSKKRESQIRSFYGKNFRKKAFVENKEKTIDILMTAKSVPEVNDGLMKIYKDGKLVKQMKETMKPLLDVILK